MGSIVKANNSFEKNGLEGEGSNLKEMEEV